MVWLRCALFGFLGAFHSALLGQETAPKGESSPFIQFSRAQGLVFAPFQLEVTCSLAGAELWFTLDGTRPAPFESPRYDGSLSVTDNTVIRVVATVDGETVGMASSGYLFGDREVREFSSNLPVVFVDSFGVNIDEESYADSRGPKRPIFTVFFDAAEESERTLLTDPPHHAARGVMRVRGQSSTMFPKKQYSLEFQDELGEDQADEVLGLPKESDWILHAPYSDKTLMRNVLAYQWAREMGHYATRTRFVEMFYSSEGDAVTMGDYVGVYLFMEKIKRDRNRVDIAKLENTMTSEPEITGGYIFKKDKGTERDVHFRSPNWHEFGFVDPEDPNEEQFQYLSEYIEDFERVMDSGVFNHPDFGYSKFIDVPSFIDVHLHVEICRNIDGFRLSTYYHKDRGGKIVMGPVWDYNLSLGNSDMRQGYHPRGWYHDTIGERDYTYFGRLFQDPEFEIKHWDRYFALRRTVFHTDKLMDQIDGYKEQLMEAQARNFERWPILGLKVWPNPRGASRNESFEEEVDWMKGWLRDRLEWLDEQFLPPPVIQPAAGDLAEDALVRFSLPPGRLRDVEILYTLNGADPRTPGGKPHPAAETVRPEVGVRLGEDAVVLARIYARDGWGALAKASLSVPGAGGGEAFSPGDAVPRKDGRRWLGILLVVFAATGAAGYIVAKGRRTREF